MAQRGKARHHGQRKRKQRASLRLRAAIALLSCAVLGMFGVAALTYPNAEIAVLAFASAPLAAVGAFHEPLAVPVMQQSAAAEVIVEKPQSEPAVEAARLQEEPRVLIYHTHATEAYLPTAENSYTSSGNWRTQEQDKSVIAVGAKLAEELKETYGIAVVHDTTDHEPPKLSTAYSRSVVTMEAYREKYPSIELYIDVHRDAYGNDVTVPTDYLTIDGTEVARLMFVVGTGRGATGTGFDEMPLYESNLALAEQITDLLGGVDSRLAREVRVKTGRYNQHVSDHCLLVEVGHNANTLEQALASVPYLARAIADAMESLTLTSSQTVSTAVWLPTRNE